MKWVIIHTISRHLLTCVFFLKSSVRIFSKRRGNVQKGYYAKEDDWKFDNSKQDMQKVKHQNPNRTFHKATAS